MINALLMILLLGAGPATLDQSGKAHDPKHPGPGLTVLDFAASWCKPCWRALPEVQALADANPDLRVLVISEDEKAAGRDQLVRRLGLKLPVVWDENHQWAQHYQPEGMPTTMVVDAEGAVLYTHVGYSPKKWAAFLKRLTALRKAAGKE